MDKVVILARISTDKQEYQRQVNELTDYCRKHKNEVDAVYFLRWDRYARNVEFAFAYKRKLYDELGIEINAIESPIDFESTEWPLLLAIYCGTAHTEDVKIARRTRTKEGIHGTLLKGKWSGQAPCSILSKHQLV